MKHLCPIALLMVATMAAAAPITYDQRQDGELNVRADLKNFVVIALVPKLDSAAGASLLDALGGSLTRKSAKGAKESKEAADRIDEHFAEPKTPYAVEIGRSDAFEEVEAETAPLVVRKTALDGGEEKDAAAGPVAEVIVERV